MHHERHVAKTEMIDKRLEVATVVGRAVRKVGRLVRETEAQVVGHNTT
jgi:hypothetical protein